MTFQFTVPVTPLDAMTADAMAPEVSGWLLLEHQDVRLEGSVFNAGFTCSPSGDSIPDFHAPDSPQTQQHCDVSQGQRQSRAESTDSSQGAQQPGDSHPQRPLPQGVQSHLAGSMLARFFGSSVPGRGPQGSPAPSATAAPAPHDSAASSFSSRAPAFQSRLGSNASVNGIGKASRSPARRRLWILPLASSSSVSEAASTVGGAVHLGSFLVVSPPFVIAVDALGQPDPGHAMLDIAASFRGTHLEGSSLMMLDAAVLADKLVIATQSWLLMYALAHSSSSAVLGALHLPSSLESDILHIPCVSQRASWYDYSLINAI